MYPAFWSFREETSPSCSERNNSNRCAQRFLLRPCLDMPSCLLTGSHLNCGLRGNALVLNKVLFQPRVSRAAIATCPSAARIAAMNTASMAIMLTTTPPTSGASAAGAAKLLNHAE